MKKKPLHEKILQQADEDVLYDKNGQLNPFVKEYIRQNYQIRRLNLGEPFVSKMRTSDFDPEANAVVSDDTEFAFIADCGCHCTIVKNEKGVLPYFKGVTKSGHLCCSRCLRYCNVCNNLFIVNQGKMFKKEFYCYRHLFILHMKLLAYYSSHIILKWEDENERNKKE